ncbi:voltage-dependent anion channel [Crucibulum laeve]|uniref:Voltage-dependent anion channel n=1 Tax=Crucibulum laeve TaxID=68775 RepID=A0A5C3MTG1_9AGAR|nr:voltage-dependent anion channel [Crucibulum laeve]
MSPFANKLGTASRGGFALVRRASPLLFASTMGTGAISILFYTFPYGRNTRPLLILSVATFLLNLVLFVLFSILCVLRYIYNPGTWKALLDHPVLSMYSGCFPMAGTTLINVATDVIHNHYGLGGKGFLYFVWSMWWLDVVISVVCCWGVVHLMKTRQLHSLDTMTAGWLLPVVTLTVAASSGGVLARSLEKYSPLHALISATFAVFMVGVGLTLALMILTVYLLRLIVHGLPQGGTIMSAFLPLGPTAQSGFAVLLIGQNFQSLLPYNSNSPDFLSSTVAGEVIYVICTCISFFLWSLASMWIVFAVLGIQHVARKTSVPFRLAFWGLVFPNGVYANLTIQLSDVFDSKFFRIYGSIYAICTLLLWVYMVIRSLFHLNAFLRRVQLDSESNPRELRSTDRSHCSTDMERGISKERPESEGPQGSGKTSVTNVS